MSSFGGTVKLTGESEYRKALAEISSNLKVLNSEMKIVTSQYDKQDKSVESLSAQNDVLSRKIIEQQKAVDILTDALEKSKAETGENSEETKKWQIKLNDAMAELNKLNRTLDNNADALEEAQKKESKATSGFKSFVKTLVECGTGSKNLGDEIKSGLTKKLDTLKSGVHENIEKVQGFASGVSKVVGDMKQMGIVAGLSVAALKLFKEEMDETGEETKETGEEEEETAEKTLKLGDIIKANLISDAIKGGLGALVDGVKALGSAMSGALTDGAAYADNILTLSAQTGLSTDALEKYSAVAELTDVSLDTMTSSMARNIKAMSQAREGSSKYAEAYEKLGISVTDADGNLRDSETVYWETIDALKGVTNETERDALAMELFGKSAQDLNTIIEMGSEGVAEYSAKAVEMGAVLGGEGLEALGNLDDEMQIFKSTTGATKNILASAFAPAMSTALKGVNGLAGAFNGLITAIVSGDKGGVESAMQMVSEQAKLMVSNIAQMAPEIVTIAVDLIKTLLQVIGENLPLLVSSGQELLVSVLSGIASNLDLLIDCVFLVLETLLGVIIDNLDLVIEVGVTLLIKLTEGILAAIPKLLSRLPEIIVAVVRGLGNALKQSKIAEVGLNMVQGLWEGIKNATSWVLDKIKGFGNAILDGIKGIFGIHSPSRLFRDEVGKNLALGVGEGFTDTMHDVTDEMASAMPTEFDTSINANVNGMTASPMSQYDMMVSAFRKALTEVKVVMDDREMGGFVTRTVERVVFA